ncbi:MAG: DnaB-like helicase C-terminal domain-containing protein, partial [bacterium]
TPSERRVLEFISNYVQKYNKLPSIPVVEAELNSELSRFPDEPLDYWAESIRNRTISQIALKMVPSIAKSAADNNAAHVHELVKELYSIISQKRKDSCLTTLAKVSQDVLEEHDKRQLQQTPTGIPFGFPYLDALSGGAQGGDFIPIVGRPSTGKTFVMQRMSISAYDSGYIPMLVTTEMQPLQYVRRILALRTKLSQNKIRFGMLPTHIGRKTLQEEILNLQNRDNPYYIVRGSINTTMKDVFLYVKDKKPDILYVDGAYMLETDNPRASQFEQVTVGAKNLKLLAQEMNIPIICTYQFKRKSGGSVDDIYQTDIVAQLASIVLGLYREESSSEEIQEWSLRSYRILKILKGREGEHGEIKLIYDMENTEIEQVDMPISDDDMIFDEEYLDEG